MRRLDRMRVRSKEQRSDGFVEISLDGFRADERLAQPDEAVVGMKAKPKQIRIFLDPYGLNSRDFHWSAPTPSIRATLAGAANAVNNL